MACISTMSFVRGSRGKCPTWLFAFFSYNYSLCRQTAWYTKTGLSSTYFLTAGDRCLEPLRGWSTISITWQRLGVAVTPNGQEVSARTSALSVSSSLVQSTNCACRRAFLQVGWPGISTARWRDLWRSCWQTYTGKWGRDVMSSPSIR